MRKKLKHYLLPVLFASIMLSPDFKIVSSLPSFRLEDIITIFYICSNIYIFKNRHTFYSPINRIFLFLIFSTFLSIILMELINEIPIITRDLFVIPLLIKYWLIFLTVRSISLNEITTKNLVIGIMVVGAVMAWVSFSQYFNLMNVNSWLTPLYEDSETEINALLQERHWRRAAGTSINANYFGYLLVSTVFCIAAYLLHSRPSKLNKFYWINLSFIGISAMFTLSRSVIVAIAILCLILMYYIIKYQKNGITQSIRFVGICSLVLILFLVFFRTDGFQRRVSLDNLMSHGSLHARKRDLITPFDKSLDSVQLIIFGQGPSKSTLRSDSHNGFGWFFQRYGLFGLLGYLSLILLTLRRSIRLYRYSSQWFQKFLSMASILVIFNWVLNEMAANIFKNPQVMSLAVFFIGISYADWSYKTIRYQKSMNQRKGFSKLCSSR